MLFRVSSTSDLLFTSPRTCSPARRERIGPGCIGTFEGFCTQGIILFSPWSVCRHDHEFGPGYSPVMSPHIYSSLSHSHIDWGVVGAIVGVLWSPSTPRTLTRNSGRITSLIQSRVVFTERVIHVAPSSQTEGQGKHFLLFSFYFVCARDRPWWILHAVALPVIAF